MQPLRLAADAQARLVEAAHARGADERADPLRDRRKRPRPPPRPFRHAGCAKAPCADEIGERLGGSILGDQLLGVEIDGRSPDASAILGRSRHPFGKGRPRRLATASAGIDETLMLGDLDQPLRQIEDLAPLEASRHRPAEARAAMATGGGLMGHDPVRL